MNFKITFIIVFAIVFFCCKEQPKPAVAAQASKTAAARVPHKILKEQPKNVSTPQGMVWVAGKTFTQGAKANDAFAMSREKPAHQVTVDGFFIDITEVTNANYKAFVDATSYITIAERSIDWEDMKKNLPQGTPKPADSLLQPGSLIFNKAVSAVVNMDNYAQWWTWKIGADWKHPAGPNSHIKGKDNFPVVHIAYEDALAYCEWANRRLPTEAEWEAAAQGTARDAIFTWGDDAQKLNENANTWQGSFPVKNESLDGFEFIAPAKSYPPNSIGIYDMMGNVWELTSDLFNVNYYQSLDTNTTLINPKGAKAGFNPDNPYQPEHIIKGGSFLCHASYCASFRISARMGTAFDSGSDHTGFRTVATVAMLRD
ncbi:SUMF1/EgtB/PvdOfamily nonheme iron enzyme [Subsaximicrobium wynnwilliamsii]|uniref:SUMF1/EgtB/PvdOfamily nonheme iron enzyme n=1 Tax=Subsaximicrobium wynnwilliamsii TaxID=291179 RepID=A0A5C6ZPG4_9FLAO|nr:formylglycine-generating enzyme family protein [Subsaximicrobium wynnwilliamsii]TXD85553.1 SUMF1/EgtB/PvdOfamily nonheme iron enzyme [Subsaximicrobium wynnwilliamsii]TXD90906.1 SUMF1/EgtB/PvdOfamily nonheme iron enzyme [Subsaximicrobium wynnwilliamsii]TXE05413.1 SUMF1/EgtB/PvdOfamily nonheme iron enzyme [Subsaximicrobium wynnwilliamsii]